MYDFLLTSIVRTVFVGSLADAVTDDTMRELFKDVGAGIKDIRWVTDHRTGKFKGCGFIEFETEEACINAVKLNGTPYYLHMPTMNESVDLYLPRCFPLVLMPQS